MKKPSLKAKYAGLVAEVKSFVTKLEACKVQPAAMYKKSENSVEMTSKLLSGLPQQFNVIEVRTLIDTCITAQQLGYMTVLEGSPDGEILRVTYVERPPAVPSALRYVQ